MERSAEIVTAVTESFALYDDRVGGFEKGAELVFEGVEVDFAIVEPLWEQCQQSSS